MIQSVHSATISRARRLRLALAFFCVLVAGCPAFLKAQAPTPAALDTELQTAQPGTIVDLYGASSWSFLNQNPNQLSYVPGNMVYSDDPETAEAYGILYRTAVPGGQTRVYAYHVNGTASPVKITAVVQNAGQSPAHIEFTRKSLRPPSGNYIHVGKYAARDFYENTALPAELVIPAGASALLDPAMDAIRVQPNQLLSAKYDFTSDQPLTVTTLMLPDGANSIANNIVASVAPGDGINRQGTFPYWGKENITPYNYVSADNIQTLRIGDPSTFYDGYVQGFDFERQLATQNYGNFGITYKFRLNVSSPDGRAVALVLNPRGGSHAGYIRTTYPVGDSPQGQLVPDPDLRLADTSKGILCAKLPADATSRQLLIEYMPPGASNLPVNLMLIPYTAESTIAAWDLY